MLSKTSQIQALFQLAGVAAAVSAAHAGGLVTALVAALATPEEYAARLGLDARATARVLDVLVAFGAASLRPDGRYQASAELLQIESMVPGGVGMMSALWAHTPAFLRAGEPFVRMDASAAERESSYRGVVSRLGDAFIPAAVALAERLAPCPARVLDVGAGSGIWSLAMIAREPGAHATALDLPQVLEAFERRAAMLGVTDRVSVLPGSYHEVELPARRFDRILLANVLHLETESNAASLIARVARALRPGGELIVIDALNEGTPERDRARALYALHLAMRTSRGAVHGRAAIEGWLRDAGLTPERLIGSDVTPEEIGALVARAPAAPASDARQGGSAANGGQEGSGS